MNANLVRILLLIALFFLLSTDYSAVVKQLVPIFEEGEEEADSSAKVESKPRLQVDSVEEQTRNVKIVEDTESKSFLQIYSDRFLSKYW